MGSALLPPKEKQNRILPARAIRRFLTMRLDSAALWWLRSLCQNCSQTKEEGKAAPDPCRCTFPRPEKQFLEPGGRGAAELRKDEGLLVSLYQGNDQLHRPGSIGSACEHGTHDLRQTHMTLGIARWSLTLHPTAFRTIQL